MLFFSLCFVIPCILLPLLGNGHPLDTNDAVYREQRSLGSKGRIRIGIYSPLVCRHLKKVLHTRNGRDLARVLTRRHVNAGANGKHLGFLKPLYCKGLESWLNKNAKLADFNPIDCLDIKRKISKVSGVYTIFPKGSEGFDVYCDMTTSGGGWTVFQRRMDGTVPFYLNWKDYKDGFGNLEGEFWLGNDRIHLLTSQGKTSLRVDMGDFKGRRKYAIYSGFYVANEGNKYKLSLSGYSGTAGNAMAHNNGRYFSTLDRDNDNWSGNCAINQKGAWWYGGCSNSNFNGLYQYGPTQSSHQGVVWDTWRGGKYSLKTSSMMLRRN